MISKYWQFFKNNNRLVSFGALQTFFSSFGQTFFISLFVPHFIQEFSLTKSSFGTLYSLATLGSAFTLPYLGQWIDRVHVRSYSIFVALGLTGAVLLTGLSWHFLVLFAGLYLLRLFGQGLTSHTAQTAMARYFYRLRGKALSITSLGYPIGEGILPLSFTALIGLIGWRMSLLSTSLFILFILLPSSIWLLNTTAMDLRLKKDESEVSPHNNSEDKDSDDSGAIWQRRDVLTDPRFYFMIPAVLLPPFLITGLFLYQIPLAESKGWPVEIMATAFTAFAVSRIAFSLLTGPTIDRFSASHLFPFYLLPFTIGLGILYLFSGQWTAFAYLFCAGITMGMSINIKSALYAELYGTKNLGTIKSLFSSLMVFSTATSPFLFGWLLDQQVSFQQIVLVSGLLTLIGSVLAFRIFPRFRLKRLRAALS